MPDILEQMQKDLYRGKAEEVKKEVKKALDEGLSAQEILNQGLLFLSSRTRS